jgi:hydrogenase expression/formation protein HypC
MCLAIPGKVLQAEEAQGIRVGRVQFGGIVRSVRLDFVPEAAVGDYVMVHVGYELLQEIGALEQELPPADS